MLVAKKKVQAPGTVDHGPSPTPEEMAVEDNAGDTIDDDFDNDDFDNDGFDDDGFGDDNFDAPAIMEDADGLTDDE